MGRAEEIHNLIDTNLQLLKAAGHRIDFTPKMFMERKSGFEAVGRALLMIIDTEECKKKIPWPLINSKAQDREFRTNFIEFIKMINSKYTDAKIPEINASSLQYPGGIKFIEFMYKLSTFALELELKKVMSTEDKEDFLPRPHESKKASDQKVQLSIIKGAHYIEQQKLIKAKDDALKLSKLLEKTELCATQLKTARKVADEQLKSVVSSLYVDEKTKESLCDISDSNTITEYNEQVESKLRELEEKCHRLKELDVLVDKCSLMSEQAPEESLCLDGKNLEILRHLNDSTKSSVVNCNGSIKLVEILRMAQTAILRCIRAPPSAGDSLLSPAKVLQARSRSAAVRAHKIQSILRRLLAENRQSVEALQAVTISKVDPKKVAETLCLQELRPLNFILPKSMNQQSSCNLGKPRQRKSFGSVLRKKKSITCSYKMRNTSKKHVSSTPIFKTPACRKSLYGPLPSGSRSKQTKTKEQLQKTSEEAIPCTSADLSHKQEARNVSYAINDSTSPQQTPSHRSKRKSINDIVDRYLNLKKRMNNSSSSSKNASDLINE